MCLLEEATVLHQVQIFILLIVLKLLVCFLSLANMPLLRVSILEVVGVVLLLGPFLEMIRSWKYCDRNQEGVSVSLYSSSADSPDELNKEKGCWL